MGSGIMEDRQFAIETPVGSIVSDSGDHLTDVVTVLGVIIILYLGKKLMGYVTKRIGR
jgi:hypothetical protein